MNIWPFHRAVPRYDHAASLATVNAMAQDHVPDKVSPPPIILNQLADISDNYVLKWASSPPPQIPPQTSIPAVQPAPKEDTTMAITFKSVGHFFATAYTAITKDLTAVESTEATVEKVTSEAPVYGPLALTVEKAGYAVLGELSAVLNAGGSAAASKLADAGLDSSVIQTVQALVTGVGNIATVAKAL